MFTYLKVLANQVQVSIIVLFDRWLQSSFFSFPFLISFHSFISPLMQIHTLQLIIEARSFICPGSLLGIKIDSRFFFSPHLLLSLLFPFLFNSMVFLSICSCLLLNVWWRTLVGDQPFPSSPNVLRLVSFAFFFNAR